MATFTLVVKLVKGGERSIRSRYDGDDAVKARVVRFGAKN